MDSGEQHHHGRRAPHHWLPPCCLALVTAVTLAGCGAHARHSQTAPPPIVTPTATQARFGTADWSCLNARERSEMFPLDGPGHDRLAALSIGTGRVAVILAHQSGGSLCQWWPYARSLAARFRVVAIDFDGSGASPSSGGNYPGEIVAASLWARHHGSRLIVLMGASMGGTAVMVAAADLGHLVAGVIDLSGPAVFGAMDALAAARRVRVPALFGYGTLDGAFPEAVRAVRAATASRDKPVVTVSGYTHGAALVDPAVGYAQVRQAVLHFIETITRGPG
jgi:pimeloyl-ACP methyl ester carboxylesterase